VPQLVQRICDLVVERYEATINGELGEDCYSVDFILRYQRWQIRRISHTYIRSLNNNIAGLKAYITNIQQRNTSAIMATLSSKAI